MSPRVWTCLTLAVRAGVEQNGKKKVPYSLFLGDTEITTSLKATVEELVRWRARPAAVTGVETTAR